MLAPSGPVLLPARDSLRGLVTWFLRNVARNSPTRISSFEIASLELQRFRGVAESSGTRITCEFWVARRVDRIPVFGRRSNTLFMVPGTHQPACISADPRTESWINVRKRRPHDSTTTCTNENTDFSALESQTIALPATRFVHPHSWSQPTKTPTFPHQQAEKSLQNQHVLSILQVGSHQLQYRFFRINNPKSRHQTNTFCPLTPIQHAT